MSAFVTLADARTAFEHLLIPNEFTEVDFVDIVNRAGERLYRRSATPGWNKELDLGNPDEDGVVITLFENISHVLAFKINDKPYYVTPLATTYKTDGSGGDRFVDLGYGHDTRVAGYEDHRYYRIPAELERQDKDYSSYSVKALVRPSYSPVLLDEDTFPFQNLEPLKLASLAILYEDNTDWERADMYMNMAVAEREFDSEEFRGPQVITIGIHDPASEEATESIV